jgi:hypothetical protein
MIVVARTGPILYIEYWDFLSVVPDTWATDNNTFFFIIAMEEK